MAKTYRTARGKGVDLSQILNDNEHVRAVGNMNVNARGDTLDSQNNQVESKNSRIKKQYQKQHKNAVVDDVVPTSKRHAQQLAKRELEIEETKTAASRIAEEYTYEKQVVSTKPTAKVPAEENTNAVTPEPNVASPNPIVDPATATLGEKAKPAAASEPAQVEDSATAPKGKGGLAAAIAKARESKQELMKTERQQARESEGVKRF